MNKIKIEVVAGDIADFAEHQTEAYVVAANNELWMGAGAAGALKAVAGEAVEQEALKQGPIEVGDAVVTSAGKMPPPARALIHAAAMGFTDRTQIYATEETVGQATRRVLELCDDHGFKSVAMPAIGTGVGGLEFNAAVTAMVKALSDYANQGTKIEFVRFVVTTDERREIVEQALRLAG